ncbi:MAG TPA: penicillin-binding transpeptidase domain-containing protein [Anaerolineales bacterium]|nr:penicillin-binding transpeptidase domain-containing protein [Anaerolineales bacterium]
MRLSGRLWMLGNVFTLAMVLLSGRVVYWQLVRGDELRPVTPSLAAAQAYIRILEGETAEQQLMAEYLAGRSPFEALPQPVIQRTQDFLARIERGAIFDRNGRVLAAGEAGAGGDTVRWYSEPSLSPVLGYLSGLGMGIAGLELTFNDDLLGLTRLDAQFAQATGSGFAGSDLVLTIDSQVQRAAAEALQGRAGAAVVLDAHTGAILAMVSSPHVDSNRMQDTAYLAELAEGCGEGTACEGIFVNRATGGLFIPGSTFKTVTLIAALDTGQVSEATVFNFGQQRSGPDGPYYVYEVDGAEIPDPNHAEAQLSLELSYAKSANAAFARIGDEMPPEVLIDYAARLGFDPGPGQVLPLEFPYTQSRLVGDPEAIRVNNWLRAVTAMGQGELQTNPLTMAIVVLAVLNGGDLPLPYLVQTVLGPDGEVVREHEPQVRTGLFSEETARLVEGMMIAVVEQGSGRNIQLEGITAGGKTGTGQVGPGELPHAWFIGFAEQGDRSVVIAVIVENAGEGHDVAAPIFATLADVAIRQLGKPVAEVVAFEQETIEAEAPGPPPADIPYNPERGNILTTSGICASGDDAEGSGMWVWPVNPEHRSIVGGEFEPIHPGVDLGAPPGAPVYAANSGQVIYSGWSSVGYGNTVIIAHGNGYTSLYAHLSQIGVACGEHVTAGETIGLAGDTGNVFGPHLHFEVRVPSGYMDPLAVLPPE